MDKLLPFPNFVALADGSKFGRGTMNIKFSLPEFKRKIPNDMGLSGHISSEEYGIYILESNNQQFLPIGETMLYMAIDGRMSINEVGITNIKPVAGPQLQGSDRVGNAGTVYGVKTMNSTREGFNDKSIEFCVFSIVKKNILSIHYKIYILNSEFSGVTAPGITDLFFTREGRGQAWTIRLADQHVTSPMELDASTSGKLLRVTDLKLPEPKGLAGVPAEMGDTAPELQAEYPPPPDEMTAAMGEEWHEETETTAEHPTKLEGMDTWDKIKDKFKNKGGGKYRKKRKKRKTKKRSRISGAKKTRRYKTRRTRNKRR